MPVTAASSAALAPARSALSMVPSRPSCGVLQRSSSAAASPGGPAKLNGPGLTSRDRSAFCRASAKDRPMAIASPTDFMCVVSAGSAPGNFSNANLGAFTGSNDAGVWPVMSLGISSSV